MNVFRVIRRTACRAFAANLLVNVLSCAAGGVLLGFAGGQVAPPHGSVVVHVVEPDVVVSIGEDNVYHVRGRLSAPIEWDLPAGRHVLKMTRDDVVLYEEPFDLGCGEDAVLTAWRKDQTPPARGRTARPELAGWGGRRPRSAR